MVPLTVLKLWSWLWPQCFNQSRMDAAFNVNDTVLHQMDNVLTEVPSRLVWQMIATDGRCTSGDNSADEVRNRYEKNDFKIGSMDCSL